MYFETVADISKQWQNIGISKCGSQDFKSGGTSRPVTLKLNVIQILGYNMRVEEKYTVRTKQNAVPGYENYGQFDKESKK